MGSGPSTDAPHLATSRQGVDEVAEDEDGIAAHAVRHVGSPELASNPNKIRAGQTRADDIPDARPHPVFLPQAL